MDRVTLLSTKDAGVRLVLLEVLGILKPAGALFSPALALKVLRQAVTQLMTEEEQKPERHRVGVRLSEAPSRRSAWKQRTCDR